jgi:hypothetical protein
LRQRVLSAGEWVRLLLILIILTRRLRRRIGAQGGERIKRRCGIVAESTWLAVAGLAVTGLVEGRRLLRISSRLLRLTECGLSGAAAERLLKRRRLSWSLGAAAGGVLRAPGLLIVVQRRRLALPLRLSRRSLRLRIIEP